MFVKVCPPVCVIPVAAVAAIDCRVTSMKIALHWTFVICEVLSVNFLKTLNYLIKVCLQVNMKRFTQVASHTGNLSSLLPIFL